MTQILVEGFLLGLATGHLCIATCGPVYAPYLMQKDQGGIGGAMKTVLLISAGRFVAYALFGLAAGALGAQISGMNRTWFTIISFLLLSLILLNSVLVTKKTNHALCAVSRWGKVTTNPVLLGVITGINFCPSFLIALTDAVHLSGPLSGLLLFVAFFVGTNIFLIPFSLFGILGSRQVFQRIAVTASVIVAVVFTVRAGMMIRTELMPDTRGVISILDKTTPIQIVTDKPEEYAELAENLRTKYYKLVTVGSTVGKANSRMYLLVDHRLGEKFSKKLVGANRFVILLPEQIDSPDDLTHFLGEYHFMFDPEKGSYFSMKKKDS